MTSTPVWPRERAQFGICDQCEDGGIPVAAWADDYADYTACEPCYTAIAEAWDALSPEEQEEALRVR